MINVAMSEDFLASYTKIPQAQQKKVREFITRFQQNPTSAAINYESIVEVKDTRVRTVRIGLEYRAIILHPTKGDVFVLVWVDHHDEAMEWARNKIFDVNPTTGALQILDTQFTSSLNNDEAPGFDGMFATFSDDDLVRTGLPKILLPAVRAVKTPEELDEIQQYLPAEAFEALYWIGNLGYSIDQALNETAHPQAPVDIEDLSAALNHPDSKRRFVSVKNVDELVEILNAPLEKWRIFLHPSQANLVSKDFSGPARILGGAGTGKTVVAMHRARYLAANIFSKPTDRILITTYSKTLANNLRNNLKSLCGPEFERIEVTHLHSWAFNFLRGQGVQFKIAEPEEIEQCWSDAFSAVGLGEWSEGFYRDEWERVIQVQDIHTLAEYFQSPRLGRQNRLGRPQRAAVWDVFDEYKRNLKAIGKLEWVDMIRQTRLFLATKNMVLPYRAVIVDETQDFHHEELKLLRQMVPPGRNDLFFVGDAHQRIYGKPVVLGQCGINIKGRSAKLRINYRTTEEIRDWSLGVLNQVTVDDLDGGVDSSRDYRSLLRGKPPMVELFTSLSEEKKFVVELIKKLSGDVKAETICLVTRTNKQLIEDYSQSLINAGINYVLLNPDQPDGPEEGIRLATMHRVKGLEFHHIIIAGANAGVIPWRKTKLNEYEQVDSERQERCLFHVACTRARDTLTITSYGIPSEFL